MVIRDYYPAYPWVVIVDPKIYHSDADLTKLLAWLWQHCGPVLTNWMMMKVDGHDNPNFCFANQENSVQFMLTWGGIIKQHGD